MRCTVRGSAIVSYTVRRGFSDSNGSWKIICTRRRKRRRSSLSVMTAMSTISPSCSSIILPELASSSFTISLPVVLLPQPDSPTRPRVSPGAMSKLIPSTAWT